MKKEEIETIVNLRQELLEKFNRLRDYKNNNNAIMKEIDCARIIHDTIVSLDTIIKEYVNFSDKK